MRTTTKVLIGFVLLFGVGLALLRASSGSAGELRATGLRIEPMGRSDAAAVMPPEFFEAPRVREAYAIAQRIPETLNQLYCWCGCTRNPAMGDHRSALECFESTHAANCDVCLANAEIAWEMTQHGVRDAGQIQKAIDERFARL